MFLFLSVCPVPSPYGPVCLSSVFFPRRSAPSFSLRGPPVPPPLTPLIPTLSLCSVLRGLARCPPLRPSCSPGPGPLAGAGGPGRRPLLPQLTPPCSMRVSLLGPPGRSSTCIFQRPVPPALTATQPLGTPVPCPQLPREPPAGGVAGKVGSPGEEAAGLGGGRVSPVGGEGAAGTGPGREVSLSPGREVTRPVPGASPAGIRFQGSPDARRVRRASLWSSCALAFCRGP